MRNATLLLPIAALAATLLPLAHRHEPVDANLPSAATTAAVTASEEPLGSNVSAVLGRFGVPTEISLAADCMEIAYPDLVLSLHAGIVVGVAGKPNAERVRNAIPPKGPYLGQAVEELAQRLGNIESRESSAQATIWIYPDGQRITLRDGIVTGIAR